MLKKLQSFLLVVCCKQAVAFQFGFGSRKIFKRYYFKYFCHRAKLFLFGEVNYFKALFFELCFVYTKICIKCRCIGCECFYG